MGKWDGGMRLYGESESGGEGVHIPMKGHRRWGFPQPEQKGQTTISKEGSDESSDGTSCIHFPMSLLPFGSESPLLHLRPTKEHREMN